MDYLAARWQIDGDFLSLNYLGALNMLEIASTVPACLLPGYLHLSGRIAFEGS